MISLDKVGEVAAQAEQRKCAKYCDLPRTHTFVPVAIETAGVFGQRTMQFLQELGRRVRQQSVDTNATSFLFQRLSVAIQRGNSTSVLGGLQG